MSQLDTTVFEDFDEAKKREARDLTIHAVSQFLDLVDRTSALTDNPLADVMVGRDLCVSALVAHAAALRCASRAAGCPTRLSDCIKLALDQLNRDAITFVKRAKLGDK